MKKIIALFAVFCVLFSMTGCGETVVSSSPAEVSLENSTPELSEAPAQDAAPDSVVEATPTPEIINTATNVTEETVSLTDEEAEDLRQVLLALIMCDYMDGMQYDAGNSTFFWRCLNYYAADMCFEMDALSEDMSWAVYSEDQVKVMAQRLFAETDTLPELPDIGMIEHREDGNYAFTLGNYGDIQLEMGALQKAENGRFLLEATLMSGEETLGVWSFELMQIDGQYCVSGILYG